jgi:hypothetical protein
MASNFTLRFLRGKSGVRIKLKGDFDGSSALILFEALKRNCIHGRSIQVDTNGIRHVYPFGRELFLKHLSSLKNCLSKIIFTGKKSQALNAGRSL